MTSDKWHQFSLATLLLACTLLVLPFGLTVNWRGDYAFLVCLSVAFALWIVTRRKIFRFALIAYLFGFAIAFVFLMFRVNPSNPYVRSYNEQLEKMAIDANLVGSSEDRVETVLGPATFVYRGWNSTVMSTGEPTPDAKYTTTYNYAPYPSFPYSKFEVHCHDGKVQSIELYDD